MRFVSAFFIFWCGSSFAERGVSEVSFSESKHTISAFSPNGEITLQAGRLQLDVEYQGGKKERGDLVTVYDPQTGHYFWRYSALNSADDKTSFLSVLESGAERAYAAPDELVDFYGLYVKVHSELAKSLAAAEQASIDEIRTQVSKVGTYFISMSATDVLPTGKTSYRSITPDFACLQPGEPGFSQACVGPQPSIISISHDGETWRLVIRGRWDLEEILDSEFRILSQRRLSYDGKK